ncbi:cytidine deaminase [Punctularia strigosozonata HHB-11173 SS5]|uniref:cytidine deaminase n=1 Tax=Punctularia strigosozonata (strain HHB-11173) TaxID=741275 RepID=UPI0004416F60|nr:cytidine deaminase [Punctularia strigosozonata HHB-11173 SS5]EIN06315.1 cytidine deaminase [Punctularia strigosozonata HHB-11173 SS5]
MSPQIAALSQVDRERLIKASFEAKAMAYCRYSNFRVGAALLTSKGEIIKGANIENASYGGTICAERTALVKAVSEGMRDFVALAVVTDVKSTISPCGMCRQVIREFCAMDMPILLVPADYYERKEVSATEAAESVKDWTIAQLLPDSFGPEQLDLPRS